MICEGLREINEIETTIETRNMNLEATNASKQSWFSKS